MSPLAGDARYALAFDPGSRLTAWALLAHCDGRSRRFSGIVPSRITLCQRGMIHSRLDDVQHLLDDVLDAAPDVIAIETLEGYAFKATSARGGGQAVVKALIETGKIESMIRTCCAGRAERIVDITARQWRKTVCGKSNAKSRTIRAACERYVHIVGMTNVHVRDAIGAGVAALWGSQ